MGDASGAASALGGLPAHYAIVFGLGAGAPAMNLGRSGSTFDRNRYLQAGNRRAVVVDAAFSGLMAVLLGGICVTAAEVLGLRSEPLLVAVAAATSVLGGNSSFVYRTVEYREFGGDDTGGV